jgi:DNA polymerase-3 subunit delta
VTPPIHLVKGDDPSLVRDAVRALVDRLVGDGDRSLVVDEYAGEGYELAAVVDAAQTPPFLTDRRVVVGRDLQQFKSVEALAPLVAYLAAPLDTTSLVVVWEGGAVHKGLAAAIKEAGGETIDSSPGYRAQDQKAWLADHVSASGLHLDRAAVDAIAQNLGQDVSRLRGILATLESTFGPGAKLSLADVEPYLGEAGGVAPWDLTDAIDRGDIPTAVAQLHRFHGKDRPWPLVIGTLHGHVQRMLAIDGSDARNEKDAAAILGMKGSTFPAKKAMDQGRRLGSDRIAQAVKLLADADRDLRGHRDYGRDVNDALVLEVLVARLAFLAKR